MKNTGKKGLSVLMLALAVVLSTLCGATISGTYAASAATADQPWYVCFASQNYALRNANQMTALADGTYLLSNVTLSGADDFYVANNAGVRYYGTNNKPLRVTESGVYSYDLVFNLDQIYADTNCHLSYRFYTPASYQVKINGTPQTLTYNPYCTAYEVYYLSAVNLAANTTISYGSESHTLTAAGCYRILFTPDKVSNGNTYKFDADGHYGSGDTFTNNLYWEDAPQYYWATADSTDYQPLTRDEQFTTAAVYCSAKFFNPARDTLVKYAIYERVGDQYHLLDDDNNADTAVSHLTALDVGWYTLNFQDNGRNYLTTLAWADSQFHGYYLVTDANHYGYDLNGAVDLDPHYQLTLLDTDADDYQDDYDQYQIYFTVTTQDLQNGPVEFYLTDGRTKYKDGTDYITLNTAGTYKILFSDTHTYSRGRHYRYTRQDEAATARELVLNNVADFITFAQKCTADAAYSVKLTVYLAADLDFAGVTFTPVANFSGTFNGGYHTLKNITLTNHTPQNAVFLTVTRTATIERLKVTGLHLDGDVYVGFVGSNYGTLRDITVSGTISGQNYVGGIAAYNGNSTNDADADTTDSSKVLSYATIRNCQNYATVMGQNNLGGIAGANAGLLTGSTNYGKVTGHKTSATATVLNVGGLTGNNTYRVVDSTNHGTINGNDDSTAVGGICGTATGTLYYTLNYGSVQGTRAVGGICGLYGTLETDNTNQPDTAPHQIIYTANYAPVTAVSYAGGIVGDTTTATLTITNAASTGDITVTAGNYAGGICGYAPNANITSCFSAGDITAKGLNAGKHVGGIAGAAAQVNYCFSTATLKGADYLGGICGQALDIVRGCYTNTLLIPNADSTYVGLIAGSATAFNASLNSFGGRVRGNYYIGTTGGIQGTEYGTADYDHAATSLTSVQLAQAGSLSPELGEDFVSEYWQGGVTATYPTLYYLENVYTCAAFDDDATWQLLFDRYAATFTTLTQDYARVTYTIVFREWQQDNGDLYDADGAIQYDNFDIIHTVRAYADTTLTSPELRYATRDSQGHYTYQGDQAGYFVSFPTAITATANTTVYATYTEVITTLATPDQQVLVEGTFAAGTTVTLIRVGDYYTLQFNYLGQPVTVTNATVKIKPGAKQNQVYCLNGTQETAVATTTTGAYLSFTYQGDYFRLGNRHSLTIPGWAWLLIGIGATSVVGGLTFTVITLIRKKRRTR